MVRLQVVAEAPGLLEERDLAPQRAVEHLVKDVQLQLLPGGGRRLLAGERRPHLGLPGLDQRDLGFELGDRPARVADAGAQTLGVRLRCAQLGAEVRQ